MKKKLVLAVVCAYIFSLFFSFGFKTNNVGAFAAEDSFLNFQAQFSELVSNDRFDEVFIGQNETLTEFVNKAVCKDDENYEIAPFSLNQDELKINDDNIKEVCEEFDLYYNIVENGYEVYSMYESKRIIVMGNVTNTYGAEKVLTYQDYNLLNYKTEEETKFAYENLLADSNLVVALDCRVELTTSSTKTLDYDYSKHKNQWGTDAIGLGYYNEYLKTNNSGEEVVVAVIDSGIKASHSAFNGRILTDANGNRVGYSYSSSLTGNYYQDGIGHGSHVSGIITDMTPSNVKILPMKVFSDSGDGKMSYIITALKALCSQTYSGYNIVAANLSLGNANDLTDEALAELTTLFTNEFTNIRARDIIPVVAAGNESEDTVRKVPAVCENAITVSALTGPNVLFEENGQVYYRVASSQDYAGEYYFEELYSNFGDEVDIAAPGSVIYSVDASTTSDYKWDTGTSMAAPHVAGAVALLSIDNLRKDDTIAQIENRLYDSAIDLGSTGKDIYYGYGMLNLKNFNGNISYTATDTIATYDGNYHNISVSVDGINDAIIMYGLSASSCDIADITTNDVFKNWTNGARTIYFKISATGYVDTIGFKTLTINKANIQISLNAQSGVYGSEHNLDSSEYSVSSGIVYGTDSLGVNLFTTATKISPVGFYHIKATITNINYNLLYNEINNKYEVTPLAVNITLNSQQSEYGDEINLDNTAYSVSPLTPIVAGDDLQVVLQTNATSASDIGSDYKITLLSNNPNYLVTATEGKYTIEPKQLTISITKSLNYGDEIDLTIRNITVRDSKNQVVDCPNIELSLTTDLNEKTPAGTYTNKLVFSTNNSNYNITSSTYCYIYRRSITIKPNIKSVTYGDTILFDNTEWSVTSGKIVNEDIIPVTLSTTYDSTTNVGTYTNAISSGVDTSLDVVKNYSITCAKGTLNVQQRNITIKPLPHSSSYGAEINLDNISGWSVVSGNIVNDDKFNVTLTTTAQKGNSVGDDYIISATATEVGGKNNYNISFEENVYTITAKDIKITISNQESVFGKEIILKHKYTIDDGYSLEGTDTLNIVTTTAATSSSPIGEYEITYVSHDNRNYNIVQCTNGWVYIKGREVIIQIIEQTFTYGDNIVLDSTKIQSEEDVSSLGIELTTTANHLSSVGKYDIVASTTNANVVLTYDGEDKLIINPKTLTVDIYNQSISYGKIELVENAYSLGATANGEEVEVELFTDAKDYDSVGSFYKISAKTNNSNYTLDFEEAILTITPKQITITLQNQDHYYSKVVLNQSAYTLSEEAFNGDNLNIKILTDDVNSNVGTNYTIYFSFENPNYSVSGNNAILTIKPLPIEIKILQLVEYGEKFTFDKEDYIVTSADKVLQGDNLNLELKTTLSENLPVDFYDIEVDSNNENYIVTVTSAQVQVTKKALTITAPSVQVEYGEEVDEESLNVEFDIDLVNGDIIDVDYELDQDYLLGIGDFEIVFSCSGEAVNNYEITKEYGNIYVYPRYVKIQIEAQTFGYGDPVEFKNLYSDIENRIINGDELNIQLSTEAKQGDPVGKYDIDYTYENENYNVEFIENYVYIKEGNIVIKLESQTFVYGEEIKLDNLKFTVNIDIDKTSLGMILSSNAKRYDGVGDHYIINGVCSNTNYSVIIEKGSLSITQRPISVTLQNQEIEYGTSNLNQTKFTLKDGITNSTIDNSQVKLALRSGALVTSEAGRVYPISFDWQNKNYLVTASNSANVIIVKRNITIESIQESVYGVSFEYNALKYAIKAGNIVNNDNLLLNFTTDADKYSHVGNYALSLVSCNSNYNVTLNEKSKFVLKPKYIEIAIELEKYYGDEINLENVQYRTLSGGLVSNDSLNLVLNTTAKRESNVGSYPITIQSCNENYNVDLDVGTLTVSPRIVVIQAIKKGEYGSYFALDNSYEVVEGSLAFASDDLGIRFSVPTANNYSNVGNYDLEMQHSNSNYVVELNHLSHFEVAPRKITFEISNQSSYYGDDINIDQTAYRLKYGTIENYDSVTVTLQTTAREKSNAGTYLLYGEIDNPNYSAKFNDAIYTINKRPITIKLNKQRTTRGLTFEIDQNAWEIVDGELLEGDSINVQIHTNAKKLSMIGNYKLMANVNSDNYDVQVIEGKLFLNISFIDIAVIAIVGAIITVIIVKIVKRRKAKQDNQKLFDKWIKW